ncbi:MAG: hypothetical protein IIX96_02910 [Clostridia bacterium]|nr:hypothetical protein [Clostridia bacterium]
MTDKLYYLNSYIKEFDATVLSIVKDGDNFGAVLDKTAFFPEGGGQTSDKGKIGDVDVLDVREVDGVIYHIINKALTVGESYHCVLDFEERLEKMQMHTAEHIVCGIIHTLYGFENVGFHLADGVVTFDVSGYLGRAELDRVEELANRAVWANLPISAAEYTPEELLGIKYRSKLDGDRGLRIVTIGDVDACACCAPHVKATGEVGAIKLLDFERHRSGTRIILVAGKAALFDYRAKYESVKKISAALCEPQQSVAEGVDKLLRGYGELERESKSFEAQIARFIGENIAPVSKTALYFVPDLSIAALRELANAAMAKTDGLIVALSGSERSYRYVIAQNSSDVSQTVKKANAALFGKGGGRGAMAQGSCFATEDEIRAYFNN